MHVAHTDIGTNQTKEVATWRKRASIERFDEKEKESLSGDASNAESVESYENKKGDLKEESEADQLGKPD